MKNSRRFEYWLGGWPWVFLIGLAISAISAGLSYMSQQKQAKQTSQVANYNAELEENQAVQADMEAREQIRRDRDAARRYMGSQRVAFAKAGITTAGSPLEILGETAATFELQAQEQARAAESRRRLGFAQAASTRWGGAQRASALRRGANAYALKTVGSMVSSYAQGSYAGAT